ncbi:MAG: hypothetical protein NC293_10905 [Roseburia sp.]|nr:hypothetical protein [Roseburia sp.]
MSEWIKEYGRIVLAVAECAVVAGLLALLCGQLAAYMEYFADRMMGG